MTNSCVPSKWLPHIQTGNYGMSQNCIDETKEYIFVKLTDSAYRAVEEYQKNETKCSARAKIQVIGNNGVISFPTPNDSEAQKFGFAIDDIEGSFECIKQTGNDLDVMGTLPYKMRIQANDDVYEKTRHRMAVAEETQKNKCTREIKPNQTDIGRKVKLKNSIGGGGGGSGSGGMGSNSNINGNINSSSGSGNSNRNGLSSGGVNNSNGSCSSVLPKRDTTASNCSPIASIVNNINNNNSSSSNATNNPLKSSSNSRSPNPSMSSSSRSSNNNNNNSNTNSNNNINSQNNNNSNLGGTPTSASSLSSALSSAAGSGTSGISNGYFRGNSPELKNSSNKNGPNLAGNRAKGKILGSNGNGLGIGSNSNNNRHKGNDITKRNIRERLIHLLALKPFKKPELYSRLQNEGIKDREKSLISTILKEISTMRDNTYNLKRQMWNDVNENWQFYTEQELQMLKRRKPQNLTPPLSSDAGSSTSGQSPTSTHNGSPPPAVKRPTSLDHRDRCYEDPMSKKPRISHFKKDPNSSSNSAGLIAPSSGNDKNQNHLNNHIDTDENSADLSYSVLEWNGVGGVSTTASGGLKICHNNNNKSPYNEAAAGVVLGKHSSPYNNSTSGNSNSSSRQQTASPSNLSINNKNSKQNNSSVIYSPSQQQPQQQQQTATTPASNNHNSSSSSYGHIKSQQQSQYQYHHNQQQQQSLHYQQQQQQQQHHHQQPPPQQHQQQQQQQQQQLNKQQHHQHQKLTQQQQQNQQQQQTQQQPRYDLSKYKKIETLEQRRQYKTEFEADFAEYRGLLTHIENVGKRFQTLASRLQSARDDADYSNIKKQIVDEYARIRNEKAHQRDKIRFDYLHVKLAHIKALVSEYDKMLTATATAAAAAAAAQQQSSTSGSVDPAATSSSQQHLTNGSSASSGTEPSSGYLLPRNKLYITPSPPQRIDGGGGGGGSGGGGGNSGGVSENGPAIHHQQQSHHMMTNDDDAY